MGRGGDRRRLRWARTCGIGTVIVLTGVGSAATAAAQDLDAAASAALGTQAQDVQQEDRAGGDGGRAGRG